MSYLEQRDTTDLPKLKVRFYDAACQMKDVYADFADKIDEFHQHLLDLCATDAGYILQDPLMCGFIELEDRSHINDYKEMCENIIKCNQRWDEMTAEQQARISEILDEFKEYIEGRTDKLDQLDAFFKEAAPIDRSRIKKTVTLVMS